MSVEEKSNANIDTHTSENSSNQLESQTNEELRWYDKRIVSFIPAYSEGYFQIVLLAFACFMLPGMYNALSGVGGAGIDLKTANNSSVALYSTYSGYGFFAGWICNIIGVRYSLMFSGIGYALYSGSLLYYTKHPGTSGAGAFVITAGALLGVCAGQLWAAQTSIIISYPSEDRKGRAIMTFWVIFNLGAVIGSAISLGNNMKNGSSMASDSTYAAFIALMGVGVLVAGCILPAHKVWKDKIGGQRVIQQQYPHWKVELMNMLKLLVKDPRIYLIFPMFFTSNWFYTYQFNDFNAARFNIRTRSLNSLLYWLSQMIGAFFFGLILDWTRFKRTTRAKIGWGIVFVLTMVIWGGGLHFQQQYTRESALEMSLIDFKEGRYIGPMFLFFFYGVYDAIFQTLIYYLLGCMSNNPKKNSIYGAIYKSIQSAGAAIVWRLDYYEVSYMKMFATSWGLCAGSLVIAAPLVFLWISEHTEAEEDDFNGEMIAVASHVEHKE